MGLELRSEKEMNTIWIGKVGSRLRQAVCPSKGFGLYCIFNVLILFNDVNALTCI